MEILVLAVLIFNTEASLVSPPPPTQIKFTNWAKARIKEQKTTRDLLNDLDAAFFKLLDALTIARSRKHITKYYKSEMQKAKKKYWQFDHIPDQHS